MANLLARESNVKFGCIWLRLSSGTSTFLNKIFVGFVSWIKALILDLWDAFQCQKDLLVRKLKRATSNSTGPSVIPWWHQPSLRESAGATRDWIHRSGEPALYWDVPLTSSAHQTRTRLSRVVHTHHQQTGLTPRSTIREGAVTGPAVRPPPSASLLVDHTLTAAGLLQEINCNKKKRSVFFFFLHFYAYTAFTLLLKYSIYNGKSRMIVEKYGKNLNLSLLNP